MLFRKSLLHFTAAVAVCLVLLATWQLRSELAAQRQQRDLSSAMDDAFQLMRQHPYVRVTVTHDGWKNVHGWPSEQKVDGNVN